MKFDFSKLVESGASVPDPLKLLSRMGWVAQEGLKHKQFPFHFWEYFKHGGDLNETVIVTLTL